MGGHLYGSFAPYHSALLFLLDNHSTGGRQDIDVLKQACSLMAGVLMGHKAGSAMFSHDLL